MFALTFDFLFTLFNFIFCAFPTKNCTGKNEYKYESVCISIFPFMHKCLKSSYCQFSIFFIKYVSPSLILKTLCQFLYTKNKSSAERFLLRVRYIWKEWSDIRMKIIILKGLCINFLPCSISWLRQVDQHIFMFRQKIWKWHNL